MLAMMMDLRLIMTITHLAIYDARNDDGFEVDYDNYTDRDDARNDDGFGVDDYYY